MDIALPQVQLLAADEIELATRIEAGLIAGHTLGDCADAALAADLQELVRLGESAREQFWLANLRLVMWVACREVGRSGASLEELFQSGCEGLGRAIERWDHARGVRFSTFALRVIRAAVLDAALSRGGAVEGPLHRVREQARVRRVEGELQARHGRSVSMAEVGAELGRDADWAARTLGWARVGLDALPPQLLACETVDDGVRAPETGVLARWVALLPEDQRRVIRLRYGFEGHPQTQDAVAARLGTSTSTVARVERRALDRMRAWAGDAGLEAA